MPTTYQKASRELTDMLADIIGQHYPQIKECRLNIDLLVAHAAVDDATGELSGPALKKNGIPARGICKVVSLKDRCKGMGDVEIAVDGDNWNHWTKAERLAILDHELNHIIICRTQDGLLKSDDHGRPKVKLRPHDFEVGWFHVIAQRHGINSTEVQQARELASEYGKVYFQAEFELGDKTEQAARKVRAA